MSNIKKLETLLKEDILIELAENVKELADLAKKQNSRGNKEELKYMEDVKAYFEEAVLNIENGSMTEEIATEILEDLAEMQIDEDDI